MKKMKTMTGRLRGYSYNEEKENDGVKKESETKDQKPPFILVMALKETNAVCYDMKIIIIAVFSVSIFCGKNQMHFLYPEMCNKQVLLSKALMFSSIYIVIYNLGRPKNRI